MCRSIKVLRTIDPPATDDDISAAALQFVRKVSGYRKPSRANDRGPNRAIVEIAGSVEKSIIGNRRRDEKFPCVSVAPLVCWKNPHADAWG